MRIALFAGTLALMCGAAFGQAAFETASVKASGSVVGPDANNRLVYAPGAFSARNATLRRLIAEGWHLQLRQVIGPGWLDRNEYDVDAKAAGPVTKEQVAAMLRALLAERFSLKQHPETRELRMYELVVDKGGPKIQPVRAGDTPGRFRGEMRQLADILAIQLTIAIPDDPTRPGVAGGTPVPVLDKTGLAGVYDFDVDIRPEPGADMFALWQRVLQERMGLRIVGRRGAVEVVVVDSASQAPTVN
jgi:uncharacterized protein (TIGR03435 family)